MQIVDIAKAEGISEIDEQTLQIINVKRRKKKGKGDLMKIVIRSGVFETNSSSTHSFTIVTAKEKQKRQEKVDCIWEEIKKIKERETTEGDKYPVYDDRSIEHKINELKGEAEKNTISFEIQSPLAKLIWLKGLIDNARSQDGDYEVNEEGRLSDEELVKVVKDRLIELGLMTEEVRREIENDELCGLDPMVMLVSELRLYDDNYGNFANRYPQIEVDYPKHDSCASEVDKFYGYLKEEYCRIENITEAEADKRIITEGSEHVPFEVILRHPESIEKEVNKLLEFNYSFATFAKKYTDKVQAFRDYVKEVNAENCQSCDGKIRCDHYFEEGALVDCYCGFQDYFAIYCSIEKAKGGLSLQEFAKEFITEKYSVVGTEWWNAFCVTQTGEVF